MTDVVHGSAPHGTDSAPSLDEIAAMSNEEAMIVGAEIDGVRIVHRRERFPIAGTRAERRAERTIAMIFALGVVAAIAFVVVFCGVVPFKWQLTGSQNFRYFTPALGATLAISLACVGVGMVLWAKWLLPEDAPGTETEQILTAALLTSGFNDLGIARRPILRTTAAMALGAITVLPIVALVGGMIKKPNRGLGQSLFHTWYGLLKQSGAYPNGVPIITFDGVRIGPDDSDPGGLATVFPVGHVTESDSPTLLIRLRPGQTIRPRKNQAGFMWEDFVAFSKICTHAGCPASLYEQNTGRLLCPCHQSQFNVLEDAKPVFGPATRSLPQLPLGVEVVDGKQYFVALADFPEPIGPAFWERP
jgi:ubiquinol-cytochrome c reductase iron-sulfur subunit